MFTPRPALRPAAPRTLHRHPALRVPRRGDHHDVQLPARHRGAPGVDDVSADTLTTAASVVGGYGALLVFFAIASTLTVNVRQRGEEISLLRSTGATPAQIKRMVVGEAAVGRARRGAARRRARDARRPGAARRCSRTAGRSPTAVDFSFGPIALTSGFGITLLASVGAAFLAVRRATRAAAGAPRRRGRARNIAACVAVVAGAASVLSTFAFDATAARADGGPGLRRHPALRRLRPALAPPAAGAARRPRGTAGGARRTERLSDACAPCGAGPTSSPAC